MSSSFPRSYCIKFYGTWSWKYVGVANLSLPGDFAFRTQEFSVTSNGITTTIHSMVPEDPSLQNRRRILLSSIGSVEVNIT